MALARVKTWNPGDVLTAADLNAEFNNLLNNPISLVSPTTGAINFQTSVLHTNLIPSAVTATSGVQGQALMVTSSAGGAQWGNPNSLVAVASVVTATGNQTFTTTTFTATNRTAILTGRSTAPRFLFSAMGTLTMPTSNAAMTILVDSSNQGGASFGLHVWGGGAGGSFVSGSNIPFTISFVTSPLSTASHTISPAFNVSTGTLTLLQGDPPYTFYLAEIEGT